MRYYVGLGNAGCKMLRHLSRQQIREAGPNTPPSLPAHFVFGDADANNNVINSLREEANRAGFQADLFELDLFWSGGCGVYHLIGELIARQALASGMHQRFGSAPNHPIYVFLAAGGGTGGGSATALEEYFHAAPTQRSRPIRLFVALPELNYRLDDQGAISLEIHGPDDFQCAAAGRFLLQYLSRAFEAVPDSAAPQRQLFVLSNSWLATVTNKASLPHSMQRLNQFLSSFVTLMDDTVHAYPIADQGQNQVVSFGLGLAATASDTLPLVPTLASQLISSALGLLDIHSLDDRTPTGLSALPLPPQLYANQTGSNGPNKALDDLLANTNPLSQSATALRSAFHACPSVTIQLVYRTPEIATQLNAAGLSNAVSGLLQPLFGTHRPITVQSLTPFNAAAWFSRHPASQFPKLADGRSADVAALVYLGNLVVEDMWQLINYYLQSSFPWQTATRNVVPVGGRVRDLLQTEVRSKNLPVAPPTARLNAWNAFSTTFSNALTDNTMSAWLTPGCAECYAEHFWGNFEQLRLKVLQNLVMTPADFESKKLTETHVARALAFLSMMVHSG